MFHSLLEDYVVNMQHHQHMWIAPRVLAVPSHLHVESLKWFMALHDEVLNGWIFHLTLAKDTTNLLLAENWGRGFVPDVEHLFVLTPSTINIIHQDGEVFEAILSSNPDSLAEDLQSCCNITQSVEKEEHVSSTKAGHLHVENTVCIWPSPIRHHLPELASSCSGLAPKPVRDPFTNLLQVDCNHRYMSRQDLIKLNSLASSDIQANSFSFKQEKEKSISLEESVIRDSLEIPVNRIVKPNEDCDCSHISKELLPYSVQQDKSFGQERIVQISSMPSYLEMFQTDSAERTSFMDFNNAGLPEQPYETLLSFENPAVDESSTTSCVTACNNEHLMKWDIPKQEQIVQILCDDKDTERMIFAADKTFQAILMHQLCTINLKKEEMFCNAVTEALHCFHHGKDQQIESEMTLPWDPVGMSCVVSSQILESWLDKGNDQGHCIIKQVPNIYTRIDIAPFKVTLDCPFYNELGFSPQQNIQPIQGLHSAAKYDGNHRSEESSVSSPNKRLVKTERKSPVKRAAVQLIGSWQVTQNTRLLYHLESRYNIEIFETNWGPVRSCFDILQPGPDVCINERTGIVLEDIANMCNCDALEELVKRLSKLSLQCCHCYVILQGNNCIYTSPSSVCQIMTILALLHATTNEILRNMADCDLKVIFSCSTHETAKIIHHVSDSRGRMKELPRYQISQHEQLLHLYPSMNLFTAQVMLTSASITTLLALSTAQLVKQCPSIPIKFLKLFWEMSHGNAFMFYPTARPPLDEVHKKQVIHNLKNEKSLYSFTDATYRGTEGSPTPNEGKTCVTWHQSQMLDEIVHVKQEQCPLVSIHSDTVFPINSHVDSLPGLQFDSADNEQVPYTHKQIKSEYDIHVPEIRAAFVDQTDTDQFKVVHKCEDTLGSPSQFSLSMQHEKSWCLCHEQYHAQAAGFDITSALNKDTFVDPHHFVTNTSQGPLCVQEDEN